MLITLEMAQQAVKRQVDKNPDKIADCIWVNNGEPVCLVACALVDLGMPVVNEEIDPDSDYAITPLENLNESFGHEIEDRNIQGIEFTSETVTFLDNVQAWQDDRHFGFGEKATWQDAYTKAMNNEMHPSFEVDHSWTSNMTVENPIGPAPF